MPEVRLEPGKRWPDGHTVGPRERQRLGWPWVDLVQPEPQPAPVVDEPTMRLPVLPTPPPDPPPLLTRGAWWRASQARQRGGEPR